MFLGGAEVLLLLTYRKIVFVHDTYIFASIVYSSAIRSILNTALHRGFKPSRGGKLSYTDLPVDEESFRKLLFSLKIPNVYEYTLRSADRNLLVELAYRNQLWFIPYVNIRRLNVKEAKGVGKLIEIEYYCVLTERVNVFQTIYDEKLLTMIKQLCLFNGVSC